MIPEGVSRDFSLKDLTWLKVGGPADFFCAPGTLDELVSAVKWAHGQGLPLTILSGGSNVLVSDRGIRGLVLGMSNLSGVEVLEEKPLLKLRAWAGTPKAQVMRQFLIRDLSPAVFLVGLPGDVGGGVAMNAGVGELRVPREFCEIVDWIEVLSLDGSLRQFRLERDKIHWEYRHSSGWQPGVITRVGFSWPNAPDQEIKSQVKEVTRMRLLKQPLDKASCGSVFRNPEGDKAGRLIDSCGLKGFRFGGAQVSPKHANFIVNDQGATASDIKKVIDHVQNVVLRTTGIKLRPEVVLLGEW